MSNLIEMTEPKRNRDLFSENKNEDEIETELNRCENQLSELQMQFSNSKNELTIIKDERNRNFVFIFFTIMFNVLILFWITLQLAQLSDRIFVRKEDIPRMKAIRKELQTIQYLCSFNIVLSPIVTSNLYNSNLALKSVFNVLQICLFVVLIFKTKLVIDLFEKLSPFPDTRYQIVNTVMRYFVIIVEVFITIYLILTLINFRPILTYAYGAVTTGVNTTVNLIQNVIKIFGYILMVTVVIGFWGFIIYILTQLKETQQSDPEFVWGKITPYPTSPVPVPPAQANTAEQVSYLKQLQAKTAEWSNLVLRYDPAWWNNFKTSVKDGNYLTVLKSYFPESWTDIIKKLSINVSIPSLPNRTSDELVAWMQYMQSKNPTGFVQDSVKAFPDWLNSMKLAVGNGFNDYIKQQFPGVNFDIFDPFATSPPFYPS